MKIEFTKGRERNLSANQIKRDKEKYVNYLILCEISNNANPMSFKELFGYEIIFRYSLN